MSWQHLSVSLLFLPLCDAISILDWSSPHSLKTQVFRDAMKSDGFVQIRNIPNGLIDAIHDLMNNEMISFFNQSIDYKSRWSASEIRPFGYIRNGLERTNDIGDSREVFSIGTFPGNRVELGVDEQYAINQWPESLDFKIKSQNVLRGLHEFSIMIAELFCESLHQNKECLSTAFEDNASELRLTKYPSLFNSDSKSLESRQGVGEHVDSGFMAFIFQSSSGLEFYDEVKGQWIDVEHFNDTLIVNTGDLAKLLSNGLYCTPKHRVMLQDTVRFTVLYFMNPNFNELLVPLEEEQSRKYRGLRWKEYLLQRFDSGSFSGKKGRKHLDEYMIQNDKAADDDVSVFHADL